jgi:CheY-like chemotaxis protein
MNQPVVMIVDDEAHVIRVLRLALERAGYRVNSACDGQAALDAMEQYRPQLLVTDIQMPRMGGRALCEAVRARYPGEAIPIIVMSSMTATSERAWAAALPDVELLEKPVSPRQLVARAMARIPVSTQDQPCTPTS